MFVTVRGIDRLGEDFVLPTCPRFYNIFHPYDPVAYRFETLIDVKMVDVPPVLIPHHKGRKRMHIGKIWFICRFVYFVNYWEASLSMIPELRETMARLSADIKEKFFDSVRSTWTTVQNFTPFRSSLSSIDDIEMERVVKITRTTNSSFFSSLYCVLLVHLKECTIKDCCYFFPPSLQKEEMENLSQDEGAVAEKPAQLEPAIRIGKLNGGCRIDYVLQEAPLESFNEYLFALTSHVGYW